MLGYTPLKVHVNAIQPCILLQVVYLDVMKPSNRNKRLGILALGALALGGAAILTFTALSQNLDYFYTPEDLIVAKLEDTRRIRLGGVVADGSVRNGAGVEKIFDVTDGAALVTVHYDGILPDLFREGQGVIAQGYLNKDGTFKADIILAKHDENYKPKELKSVIEGIENKTTYP